LKNYDFLKDKVNIENSHEICTLLKQVILELSEPLIPFSTYEKILKKVKEIEKEAKDAGEVAESNEKYEQKKVDATIEIFNEDKNANKEDCWALRIATLLYIAKPLKQISDNFEKTKINKKSIGVLVGNVMFRPEVVTLDGVQDHGLMKDVFAIIV